MAGASWIEVAHGWVGTRCIVCGTQTNQWIAPMGIVSGRVRCHLAHDNEVVMLAYFRWCDEQAQKTAQPTD